MAKRSRHRRVWTFKRTSKFEFLTNVHARLKSEVEPCLASFWRRHTGFFAGARMLFPLIEAVATVMYRTKGGEGKPALLLARLGFSHPQLVWQMYRHTLMHNDEMAAAAYRKKRVAWSMGFGDGHTAVRGMIHVDLHQLYRDLAAFLEEEIALAKKRPTSVWIKDSFRFGNRSSRAVRREMLTLGS